MKKIFDVWKVLMNNVLLRSRRHRFFEFLGRASIIAVQPRCRPESRQYVLVPECCGLSVIPIPAGLEPAGSQLVSYHERIAFSRSPSGSLRWKPRLGSYYADTPLRILSYFPNVQKESLKFYAGFIPCTKVNRRHFFQFLPANNRVAASMLSFARPESLFDPASVASTWLVTSSVFRQVNEGAQ